MTRSTSRNRIRTIALLAAMLIGAAMPVQTGMPASGPPAGEIASAGHGMGSDFGLATSLMDPLRPAAALAAGANKVEKSVSPAQPAPGDLITFTVTLTLATPQTGVVLDDTLGNAGGGGGLAVVPESHIVPGSPVLDGSALPDASTSLFTNDLNRVEYTLALGNLAAGVHTITYSVQLSSKLGCFTQVSNGGNVDVAGSQAHLTTIEMTFSLRCNACTSTSRQLIVPPVGVSSSVWPNGTISLAFQFENHDSVLVKNVQVTQLRVPGGTYLGPGPLPLSLGDLAPDQQAVLNAQFTATPNVTHPLLIGGLYTVGSLNCTFAALAFFQADTPNNNPIPSVNFSAAIKTVGNSVFPPLPPPPPPGFEFNAEFDVPQPLGQPQNFFPGPIAASALDRVRAFTPSVDPPSGGNSNSVVFTRNTLGTGSGLPPDPSVAGSDATGFVMFTTNTSVRYSTDFGSTFTSQALTGAGLDPGNPGRNAFFPENDGGLCCDQVLTYVPSRNLMVWLLQYNETPITAPGAPFTLGANRLRIAFATPQAAAADFLHAWRWFDLTSATFGIGGDWMDFPDLAFSNNNLYVGVDHGFHSLSVPPTPPPVGTTLSPVHGNRHIFARVSLNDMANPSSTNVGGAYVDPTRNLLYQNHIVQSHPDTFFWSALPDTSTLVVYSWPDSSGSATPHDITITTYLNTDFTVNAPDNLDWNVAPKLALGAAYTAPSVFCPPTGCVGPTRFLYFAFSAGRDNAEGRPFPYVRVEKIDADAFTRVSELDIYNPGFAFSTPALVTRPVTGPGSGRDEVAISLAVGGGGSYADNAVGFLGDFLVYLTTSSDATQQQFNGPIVRYGDYFSVRNSVGPPTTAGQGFGYSTLGYAIRRVNAAQTCNVGGCNVNPRYVLFGHDTDLFPQNITPPR